MQKRNRTPGLYRRGKQGIYYVQKQFKVGGKRISLSESTGTASYEEAVRYLDQRIRELRDEHIYGRARRLTLMEAADRMLEESQGLKSIDRYELTFRTMIPHLGELYLDEIHDGTVQPYVKHRLDEGVAATTVEREIACLVRCLNLAHRRWRDDAGNPYLMAVPMISRPKGKARKPHPLSKDEFEALLSELPEHLRDVLRFAVHTGARDSEIRSLRWSDLCYHETCGLASFRIPGERTKNGEGRDIILNSEAWKVVKRLQGQHEEYVFTYEGEPYGSHFNNTAWQNARKRAGVNVRFHDARHTTGHWLRYLGVPEADVAQILGHKKGKTMTDHYSAPTVEKLTEAAEKMVAVLQKPDKPLVQLAAVG